jgi:HD-GYP domain-containing protein (c-di-GMP phosphodiesterase class II)
LAKPTLSPATKEFVVEDFTTFVASLVSEDHPFHVLEASDEAVVLSDDIYELRCLNSSRITSVEDTFANTVVCGSASEIRSLPENPSYPLTLPMSYSGIIVQLNHFFSLLHEKQTQIKHVETADKTLDDIRHVLSISRELNGIRDIDRLLDIILAKVRLITSADAGSIYVVNKEKNAITFKITQNDSMAQSLREFTMEINAKSIVGNCVLLAQSIAIKDLYKLKPDPVENPYNFVHDTSWDKRTGYECHSMVSIPVFNIAHDVIGVIQLINRKVDMTKPLKSPSDFESNVGPFTAHDIDYAEILAHQAGIALENAYLTQEKEDMFSGFVNASVHAIEQRDPTTSGHSHRVADLSLAMAEAVNRTQAGAYGGVSFNPNQLKEIRYASLLHDFGKIGVPESVLVKEKKLYPHELELILDRFELIKTKLEIDFMKEKIKFIENPLAFPPGFTLENLEQVFEMQRAEINADMDFILKSNEPTILSEGSFEKLHDIAKLVYEDSRRGKRSFLLQDELKALSVAKGSLTSEEFKQIQSHVVHTFEFLKKIPWGKELGGIPEIAGKHHEKLDGSGYPDSIKGDLIPAQSRIMTIADIFDALTAADRPYKKAVPIERALDIIHMEVKAGKCDAELFQIFTQAKCWEY